MATNDKHCQTFVIKTPRDVKTSQNIPTSQQMYDETVPVLNAKEVKSPSGTDSDSQELVAAMSKFNPPVRHTAKQDFDSGSEDSDTDDDVENFLNNGSDDEDKSPERESFRPSNRPSAAAARRSPDRKSTVPRPSERQDSSTDSDRQSPRKSPEPQNAVRQLKDRQNPRGSPELQNSVRQSKDRQNPVRQSINQERNKTVRQSPDRKNPVRQSSERKVGAGRSPVHLQGKLAKDDAKEVEFGRTSRQQRKAPDSSDNSESDSNDLEMDRQPSMPSFPTIGAGRKRGSGLVIPSEGAYDPKHFQDLKMPAEMDNIFQYIMKYTPQKVDIEFKLQPFIPDYVPAVGDIDPFIKVTTPACAVKGAALSDKLLEHIDNLGLTVLDEPSAEQSDSALLHLQLRAFSKSNSAKSTVLTKKIEYAEKNPKSIERWIKDVSELHLSKPAPNVNYTVKMPDIDNLMEEWPTTIEETLNEVGFPRPTIDCTLQEYAAIVCGTFDIPLASEGLNDYIQALHVLFSLFLAVKNSQLYAERQKEDKSCSNL